MSKAKTPAIVPLTVVPDVFALVEAGKTTNKPLVATVLPISPYVQFMHPMAKNYGSLVAAVRNQPNGTPVLVDGDSFTMLAPFTFMVTPAFHQYYAKGDGDGEPIAYSEPIGRTPVGWSEFVDAVIILHVDGEQKVARCRFKGPKCPVVKSLIMAMQNDAESDDFATRSKDHGRVVNTKLPTWTWHSTTGVIRNVPPKKPGAFAYDLCEGVAVLTPLATLALLAKAKSDVAFSVNMASCLEDHNKRMAELQALPGDA